MLLNVPPKLHLIMKTCSFVPNLIHFIPFAFHLMPWCCLWVISGVWGRNEMEKMEEELAKWRKLEESKEMSSETCVCAQLLVRPHRSPSRACGSFWARCASRQASPSVRVHSYLCVRTKGCSHTHLLKSSKLHFFMNSPLLHAFSSFLQSNLCLLNLKSLIKHIKASNGIKVN